MAVKKAIKRIEYAYPIESMSRKMTLRRNTASDLTIVKSGEYPVMIKKEVARYFGGGVRETFIKGLGAVKKNYVFIRFNKRNSEPSTDELAARTAFGTAAQVVNAWRKNIAQFSKIKTAWDANATVKGYNPIGHTLHQWLFLIALALIGAGESTTNFPYNA